MTGEMHDLGRKQDYLHPEGPSTRPKVLYPELHVQKDLGDYTPGQAVSLVGEGVVTAIRKDKYGESITIEVHKLACTKHAEAKKVGERLAGEYMSKKD